MSKRFSLLIAMVLLLGLLPAVAAAAPPKPPYISVGNWTLPMPYPFPSPDPIGKLSAWGINWKVPKAAWLEFGYTYRDERGLQITFVEKPIQISQFKYPQNFSVETKSYYLFTAGGCTLQQFINILDRSGEVAAHAESVVDEVCIEKLGP